MILQPGGKPFTSEQIIECEFYLVQAMDCCLVVFHPYRSLVEYANESKTADREFEKMLQVSIYRVMKPAMRTLH